MLRPYSQRGYALVLDLRNRHLGSCDNVVF
jgi:hypothetical protein